MDGSPQSVTVSGGLVGAPMIGTATAGNARPRSPGPPAANGGSPITGYYVTPYIGSRLSRPEDFNTTATARPSPA